MVFLMVRFWLKNDGYGACMDGWTELFFFSFSSALETKPNLYLEFRISSWLQDWRFVPRFLYRRDWEEIIPPALSLSQIGTN